MSRHLLFTHHEVAENNIDRIATNSPLATLYTQSSLTLLIVVIDCEVCFICVVPFCFIKKRNLRFRQHEGRRRTGRSLTDTHSYVALHPFRSTISSTVQKKKNKPRKRARAISECQTTKMKHTSRVFPSERRAPAPEKVGHRAPALKDVSGTSAC